MYLARQFGIANPRWLKGYPECFRQCWQGAQLGIHFDREFGCPHLKGALGDQGPAALPRVDVATEKGDLVFTLEAGISRRRRRH